MPNGPPPPSSSEPERALAKTQWAVIGIFLIMAFGALSVAQSVFIPIVSALMLALVFSPVRRALGKLGIGPGLAATLISISAFSTVAFIIYAASGTLAQRLTNAPEIMEHAEREVRQLLGAVQPMLDATRKMTEMAGEPSTETVAIRQPGFITLAAQGTPEVFGQIVITLTLAFFLIASGDLFYEKLVQAMPTFKDKRRALEIAREIEGHLSNYLFKITAINAAVAVLVGLVALGFGLPDPLLFCIAAFLLNYIPYLGPIAGSVRHHVRHGTRHARLPFRCAAAHFPLLADQHRRRPDHHARHARPPPADERGRRVSLLRRLGLVVEFDGHAARHADPLVPESGRRPRARHERSRKISRRPGRRNVHARPENFQLHLPPKARAFAGHCAASRELGAAGNPIGAFRRFRPCLQDATERQD